MIRRWAATLAAVAATAAAVLSATGTAGATTAPGTAVGLLGYSPTTLQTADVGNYNVIIINASEYNEVPTLRAANPNVKILVYKDIAATMSYAVQNGQDLSELASGVGYEWAEQNHPDWFLTDTSGNQVQWADYPGDWWMDVGNVDYQNTWAQNVIADAKTHGVDGVFMDDVNMSLAPHLPAGVTLAKYQTDAAYAAATESFLANVAPQLRAAGLMTVQNLAFPWSSGWQTAYQRWISYTDGVMLEHWVKPGQTSAYARYGDNDWTYQMEQAQDVLAAGKLFFPLTYGDPTDTATQTYARASFLMAWNGGASALFWVSDSGSDYWTSAWTADVGQPAGAASQLASGVWERPYSGGLVLVNPSRSNTVTVTLPGSYLDASGATVTSVTLAPTTGAVLTVAGTTTSSSTTSGSGTTSGGTTSGGTTSGTTKGHGHSHHGPATSCEVSAIQQSISGGVRPGWCAVRQLFLRWHSRPGSRQIPVWRWHRLHHLFRQWWHQTHGQVRFGAWRRTHRLVGVHRLERILYQRT